MSGHQFTFPLPPPAPPKASQSCLSASQPSAGPNGFKGRRDSKDLRNRGHGHGFSRVSERNGPFGSTHHNSCHGNPSLGVDKRYSSQPSMGYDIQANGHKRDGYLLPGYPHVRLPQLPPNVRQGYELQNQAFPPTAPPAEAVYPANGNGSYQNYNGRHQYYSYGYGLSLPTVQAPLPAARNGNLFQTHLRASQPVLMGPPIRMGFDEKRKGSQTQQQAPSVANRTEAYQRGLSDSNGSSHQDESAGGFPSRHQGSLESFPGNRSRGQKHGYEGSPSPSRPRSPNQLIQVAPAVPSFGSQIPLPLKPPALPGYTRKPRKKKRRYNQLGLTPKMEEHEFSEDEDDTDEEARLAAVTPSVRQGDQPLQFDYKGRTSTLQSSSDIAAWIEERKKRFPTKTRTAEIAEGRRQCNNQHKAGSRPSGETQQRHRSEVWKGKSHVTERGRQQGKGGKASEDVAAKSKRKVEKLRKQLEKEERRIAKAEAHGSNEKVGHSTEAGTTDVSDHHNENKKRKRVDSGETNNAKIEDANLVKQKLQETASIMPDPLTPTSQPALADEERYPQPKVRNTYGHINSSAGQEDDELPSPELERTIYDLSVPKSDSKSDSSLPGSEDNTSSSGSSFDSNSEGAAHDETPMERERPESAALSKRAKQKQTCKTFLHQGFCKRGSNCKYLHELPKRGSRGMVSPEVKGPEGRKKRIGLYQRLLELEKL